MRISDWSSDVCSSDLYVLRLLLFELAPILIGFILGPMVEENLRRAMLIYRGDFFEIILRPISGTMLGVTALIRSEEHTSELQSLMRISYAVFCLKKKKKI